MTTTTAAAAIIAHRDKDLFQVNSNGLMMICVPLTLNQE